MPKNNDGRKSKYLRDPNEKKSKYLRDENDKKLRSLKDEEDKNKHHFRVVKYIRDEQPEDEIIDVLDLLAEENGENAAKSTEPQVLDMILDDIGDADNMMIKKANGEAAVEADDELLSAEDEKQVEIAEAESVEDEQKKGDSSAIFKHSKLSKATTVVHINSQEEKRRSLIISMVIIMTILTAFACVMQFATFTPPYFPTMLNIEFSAFPELIASVAYGPFFGIVIILIKNIVHIIVANNGYVSELSNFILDSTFITIVGLFYTRRMFALPTRSSRKDPTRDRRRIRIFLGGIIGTAATSTLSFFTTRFISYPLLLKQYAANGLNDYFIIVNYQQALNRIKTTFPELFSVSAMKIETLTQAVFYYNVPITVLKFLFITLVSSLVYVIISPYLHFRRNSR